MVMESSTVVLAILSALFVVMVAALLFGLSKAVRLVEVGLGHAKDLTKVINDVNADHVQLLEASASSLRLTNEHSIAICDRLVAMADTKATEALAQSNLKFKADVAKRVVSAAAEEDATDTDGVNMGGSDGWVPSDLLGRRQ
jgi:hypothetical protein